MPILVATDREVVVPDVERGTSAPTHGIGDRPTCLATDPLVHGRASCGTHWGGVHGSDDRAKRWRRVISHATSPLHVRGLVLVP